MQVRRPTTPGVPRVHAHLPSRRVRSAAEGSQQAVAKPAAAEVAQRPALTFHVVRSVTGELPVYSKISNGRTRRSTVLRKYTGDVEALRQARPCVPQTAPYGLSLCAARARCHECANAGLSLP